MGPVPSLQHLRHGPLWKWWYYGLARRNIEVDADFRVFKGCILTALRYSDGILEPRLGLPPFTIMLIQSNGGRRSSQFVRFESPFYICEGLLGPHFENENNFESQKNQ
ncbi:hypothetical protein TNCV_2658561 [Trichonephila clavipes]|nr:hypothetical protein TNCV_2658561 [Trichonephila clavipes]